MIIVHNLTWSQMKDILNNGYTFQYETLDSNRYYIFTFIAGDEYSTVLWFTQTADKTDFDNNYASDAVTDSTEALGTQNARIFRDEALASNVYEDSRTVVCHGSRKTFNIENKHATGGLKFKVWGSPNKSEWELVIAETTLAALSKVSVSNMDFWKFVKMSATGDATASTINAYLQVES